MDFPALPPTPVAEPQGLRSILGVDPLLVAQNGMDLLVHVDSDQTLRGLAPDMEQLRSFEVRGLIVTTGSDSAEFDFVSRFFAPSVGVPEDHATGSAHCCLGPYWSERLGKTELRGFQASPRGAVIEVNVRRTVLTWSEVL
jgi:predicted PhzF superfamily epimerase YddE/YHI9